MTYTLSLALGIAIGLILSVGIMLGLMSLYYWIDYKLYVKELEEREPDLIFAKDVNGVNRPKIYVGANKETGAVEIYETNLEVPGEDTVIGYLPDTLAKDVDLFEMNRRVLLPDLYTA